MSGSVAAVDLGATSGRVILGRVGSDTLETHQIARFANDPVQLSDGLHWNLVGMYGAALDGLRTAFRAHPQISSIGVDSWAVDYGLLRDGRLLGEPYHYRDDRTGRGVVIVHERMSHAALYARNGLQFLPFNTLYQLAAEPAPQLAFADTALLIPDIVAYWLTGISRAERTNASTTGLMRVADGEWDDELLSLLAIRPDILPPLISAGERVGSLLPAVARSIGAADATAVTAVGSHDTASAVVAVPMRAESAVYISCGTWGLVGVEVEQPVLSAEALAANYTNEGGVDGRVRLLRNVMGLWVLSETLRGWNREGQDADLTTLLDAAAQSPDNVPVFDVNDPRFMGPISSSEDTMPARIDSWCVEHGMRAPRTRVEYVRSIVESLAQAFADASHRAAALGGVDARAIHVVGGGALNRLLCQRTADRAGMPVLAGPAEATALGNVLVQARAVGLVTGSLESLRDLVARTHTLTRYEPRA